MNMHRMLCALLILCLLPMACVCAEASGDPVVVRVGNYAYPKSLVEFMMRAAADDNGALWEALSREEKEAIRDMTIRQVVGIGVIENKLAEQGKHDFTADEEELLRSNAQAAYDQMWTNLYQYMRKNNADISEEDVTEWLEEMGYTLDMYFENAKAIERQFRMFDLYCADVKLTDSEMDAYYQETYVKPDQERYEHDIPTYEKEILLLGNESFFVPEGYRYLKWILIPYPDELLKEARPQLFRLYLTENALKAAYDAMAEAAATVEDMNELLPYRASFDECKADNDAAGEALTEKLRQALPMAEEIAAEVRAKLRQGTAFEQLVNKYSADSTYADPANPGVPFHPDSPNWSDRQREGIATLKNIGDLSSPVLASEGIYLLYYAADVPSGAHELTDEERNALAQNAQYAAQLNRLNALLEAWKPDYEIVTNESLLDMD